MKMRRFISLLTAFVLVLSMIPAVSFAAELRTVYLDPANGADTNTGLAENAPVQTVAAAYAALNGASEGTVVFLDTLVLTAQTTFPSCSIPVTLTSQTGSEGITSNTDAHILFGGDTTLEQLTMTSPASSATYISAEGYDLTIGEDVICKNSYYCLTGRYGEGSVDGLQMTVKSGTWRNVLAAGYKSATTGDVTLTVTGGKVTNLLLPTYSGNHTGNVTMNISGATVQSMGVAPNTTGTLTGNVDMTIGDGVNATKLRIRRNTGNAAVSGTATVTVDGDCSGIQKILHENSNGKITKTRLVLKSGVLATTPCTFDEVSVEIPTGKTMTLAGCDVTADTVNSAGTLVFSGAASLTTDTITGSLNCTISGTPEESHTYVTAPAGSTVTFPADSGVTETDGQWQTPGAFDESTFKGLVVRAQKGVAITLYTQYKANTGSKVTPTRTVEGDTQNSYYYAGASGAYRCVASQSGYYKLTKNIYMSPEEANTCTEQIITLDKRAGGTATDSWEVSYYQEYTDEMLALDAYNDDISQWPEYADVFTTPWFTETHAAQQQTTQEQMEKFLFGMDDADDNMYIFSMGKSGGYEHDVWVIFYTDADLSSATTAEEAAAMLGQDKPTVMYRAQIHGNEPAAGEAALAVAQRLDGDYGDSLIENINIVMVPRANPDGSQNFLRLLASGVDANRDMLRVESQEITDYLKLYQIVEPEMVIDGHEYDGSAGSSYFSDSDITVGAGFTENNTDAYVDLSIDLIHSVFDAAAENGLTYRYYSNQLNSNNANISRPYFGQQGCLSFLLETRGNGAGLVSYARRIVTQVISVEKLLTYASDNSQAMQQLVDAEKQYIVEKGKTYQKEDLVYLSTAAVSDQKYSLDLKRIYQNGNETTVSVAPGIYNSVQRSRIAPTAYVIPAGATFTQQVLELMDKQDIAYTYIPAGATVWLQQYTGTATEAGLTAEKAVTFGQGAYVFTLNQIRGVTLSMLMEPDVTDLAEQSGTLAQQGIITPVGGYFPIYRYCYDLNADGFINYSLQDAEAAHVTVYLDGTNGADTNDGLTEGTAVKTMEQAYATMAASLQAAGEGSTGTLVIIGLYELGAASYDFPSVGFPVTITGRTTADGISFTGGSSTDAYLNRAINLHGETTFQNIKLHVNNKGGNNFIYANGHKLVMGVGINTTVSGANCYFTVSGGSAKYGDKVASVDVTIRSGSWRNIYLGGYYADVTGLAKLDISNASVYYSIAASYRGNVGSLEMNISDTAVSVTTDATHGIFAGTYTANSKYDSGKVLGDVTITLGENVTAEAVYGTARLYGRVLGDTTIVADGVDLSVVPVKARYSGLSASYPTGYVELQLNKAVTVDVTIDPTLVLDLNGYDITGALTVDGTLSVKDSQTDDYTVADGFYGEITGTVTGTLAAAEGYVAVDGQSFHRFTQNISHVSIRPSIAGIYYSSIWCMDEVLAANVDSYGVSVTLADKDTVASLGIGEDSGCLWTSLDTNALQNGGAVQGTGVMIGGIMKTGLSDNAERAAMDIRAAAYLQVGDTTLVSTEVAYSMQDVMEAVDDVFSTFTPAQKQRLKDFYDLWKDDMASWDLTEIPAYQA